MSEREEVTAILSDVYDDIHNRKYDLEKSADRIMKLPVFEKLERVREYCEDEIKNGHYIGAHKCSEHILSLLNQPEEFDFIKYLDELFEKGKIDKYLEEEGEKKYKVRIVINYNKKIEEINREEKKYFIIIVLDYLKLCEVEAHNGLHAVKYFGRYPAIAMFDALLKQAGIEL